MCPTTYPISGKIKDSYILYEKLKKEAKILQLLYSTVHYSPVVSKSAAFFIAAPQHLVKAQSLKAMKAAASFFFGTKKNTRKNGCLIIS